MQANQIKIGDVIMPPKREVQLWMRRHAQERGLPESALYLTVTRIDEGKDRVGSWLYFETMHAPEWNAARSTRVNSLFRFKARPETEWIVINEMEVA